MIRFMEEIASSVMQFITVVFASQMIIWSMLNDIGTMGMGWLYITGAAAIMTVLSGTLYFGLKYLYVRYVKHEPVFLYHFFECEDDIEDI